jgi:Asp-tRNA(Asn)/Glu-tRNA(Gln) amidotransferase A subunit family amidase
VRTALFFVLLAIAVPTAAQSHPDPLTEREVDKMRDTAQDPAKRIDLLLSFTRQRIDSLEHLAPSVNDADTARVRELLGEIAAIVDELDSNLSMYDGRGQDLRHPLHRVLDAEAGFQQRLKALFDAATPVRRQSFAAALQDAAESIRDSSESARTLLDEQSHKHEGKARE